MYKNLDPAAIHLSCSQNQLIELALTHRFRGLSLDFGSFQQVADERGLAHAARFLKSAPIQISSGLLPIGLGVGDGKFRANMMDLPKFVESAKELGCQTFTVAIAPGSIDQPYHENFELHRQRVAELAAALHAEEMQLGLTFYAARCHRVGLPNPFINTPEALVALLKTCVAANLGIVVDVWDWTVGGGSAELLADLTADQVIDVRLSDLPVGFDAETIDETGRLMPASTGEIDVRSYVSALDSMQYQGSLTAVVDVGQFAGQKKDAIVQQVAQSLDQATHLEAAVPPAEAADGSQVAAGADQV